MLISDDYRALNTKLHLEKPEWSDGHNRMEEWARTVANLADAIKARDVLDYGAGTQRLAASMLNRRIHSYDPAIPAISGSPESADLVVSLSVLEHVEPEYVDEVLDHIRLLAKRAVFFTITTVVSGVTLEDGSNVHRTVQPLDWWLEKLMSRWGVNFVQKQNVRFIFIGETK